MTPLAYYVADVIDCAGSMGRLFLLRPRTVLGAELTTAVRKALEYRSGLVSFFQDEAKRLRAEVDGLREQNAKLTEALQAASRPRMHSEECDEHLIQLERDLAHAAAANEELTEAIQVAESDRDHAISFQAANTSRCECLEDQIQRLEAIIGGVDELLAQNAKLTLALRAAEGSEDPNRRGRTDICGVYCCLDTWDHSARCRYYGTPRPR